LPDAYSNSLYGIVDGGYALIEKRRTDALIAALQNLTRPNQKPL